MSERVLRAFFVGLGGTMLLSLAGVVTWRPQPKLPDDAKALAKRLQSDPADFAATNALTEAALDSDVAKREELWRGAFEHAHSLAPARADSRTALVRSGFFHWYELDDPDKNMVLQEAEPLLREPAAFRSMAPAIWRLTHDFAFLRRTVGRDYASIAMLRDIAATNGLFADYRELRTQATRARTAQLASESDPTEMIPPECTTDDQPMIEAIVAELHDHPIDKHPSNPGGAERLADYAIRHHVGPLDGLAFLASDASISAPTRARVAIALGDVKQADLIETGAGSDASPVWSDYFAERAAFERARGEALMATSYASRAAASSNGLLQWNGRCGDDVCTSAHKQFVLDAPRRYTITLARVASDEVPPYVEVYVDDARIGEAAVAGEETFTTAPLPPGRHRVTVRVINPFTRNLAQRRVRIVRDSPL